MSDSKLFKDWFDRKAAQALASQVAAALPEFDAKSFVRAATHNLSTLEMMDRVRQFSSALREHLPTAIPDALLVLEKSLPEPMPDCESVTDGWLQWPLGQFIADYAVDHYPEAMRTMHALTQRFSSEFAVRPFIDRYPKRVFSDLKKLTRDPSPHVRRWCSEGIRPRLPWGARLNALIEDPAPVFPVLRALRDDPELYVRRSVANCLNDVAKDHPDRVLDELGDWSKGASESRLWVIRHAARSLVKAGNPRALALLGFERPKSLDATLEVRPKRAKIGESVQLALSLKNRGRKSQQLMVDFVVHYRLANGGAGPKVFKWTQKEIDAGEKLELTKKLSMKPTTIRTLRAGDHRIEVQINGVRLTESNFRLVE